MTPEAKEELINKMSLLEHGKHRRMLAYLKIPEATFYRWQKAYFEKGIRGLIKKSTRADRVWNRRLPEEENTVLEVALNHPEMSPRLIAVEITDKHEFFESEKTVQRILKEHGKLYPRPMGQMPAAKEYRKKTTRVDEMWQCDGTYMFVVGWGFYRYLPVLDDFSRKVLTAELMLDESGFTASDAMEQAMEEARRLGHSLDPKPVLLTDNGSAFKSDVFGAYLNMHGIRHIFGRPYHPQTQGKVERFNRTIKGHIYLIVYCSPDELREALKKAVAEYNARPHEAHQNVCPDDVYAGRKEEVLQRRAEKKKLTIERRRAYNLGQEVRKNV
jgi:putative transposase